MRTLLALLVLVLVSCGADTSRVVAMRDVKFPVRDFKFPSGLRVLFEEDHRSPLVAVVTWVGSGSTSDPPGKEGLAHYVEHLAFRTRPGNRTSVVGLLERAGASPWNAFTDKDETVFHETGPKDSLGALLATEGARLLEPIANISEDVAKIELEVVQNERRERTETGHAGGVMAALDAAVFPPSHPYARSTIGSDASVASLSVADAERFAKEHYRPSNVTMVIVGDVDLATVGPVLDASLPKALLFDRSPAAGAPRLGLDEPPPDPPPANGLAKIGANVATPELWIGWSLPRGIDESGVANTVLTNWANNLVARAVLRDEDISGISAGLRPGKVASLLYVRVLLRDGVHPGDSLEHVLNTVYDAGRTQSQDAVNFSLRRSFTAMLLDAQDLEARGETRAELTHWTLEPAAYSRRLRALASTQPSKIADVARRYITRERARAVLVTPIPELAAPRDRGGRAGVAEDGEPDASYDAAALRAHVRPAGVARFKTVTLPNGLEIVLGRREGLPVATVAVAFGGGNAAADPYGADTVLEMLGDKRVTSKRNPVTFGVHTHDTYGEDRTTYLFEATAGNVDDMVSILADWTPTRRVDGSRVEYTRSFFVPYLERFYARPDARADAAFTRALFGDRGYGRRLTADVFNQVGASDADGWAERTLVASNATVAIVGEIDVDKVEQAARDAFGGWSAGKKAPLLPAAPLPTPSVLVVHRGGASQASVRLGCRLTGGVEDATRDVMAELLAERLRSSLRTRTGSSYGAHVSSRLYRGGTAELEVSAAIVNADLAPSLKALRRAIDDLATHAPSNAELEVARWHAAARYATSFVTTREIVERILAARNVGRTLADIDGYPQAVARVGAAELAAAARGCVDSSVVSILGDDPTIRAALATPAP